MDPVAARLRIVSRDARNGLRDHVVRQLRARHYSPRTEKAYLHWIGRFIGFHRKHPMELTESDVNAFLSHLAIHGKVAASTQNQALAAVLFLYEHVLEQPLDRIEGVVRARRPARLPDVLSREEVDAVLRAMDGKPRLVATLLYGTGLRLGEGLSLRIKDIDFARGEIVVRDGKGQRDRHTMLPRTLHRVLSEHLLSVSRLHETDLRQGLGRVPLPGALRRKCPNAETDWPWQGCFPRRRTIAMPIRGCDTAITCTSR